MAVRIPIVTVFDPKGLKQAQYAMRKVQGNVQNLGRNLAITGAALGVVTAGLARSVKVASDLGESINAINVSFGKSAKGILEFGENAATALGLSQVEFNNAAVRFSGFADKIVGAGNDSSKFIEQITTRAADFASVYNIDVADALERFQSGLAGQTEPLAKFGVNLLDSEVKAYAVRAGLAEVGKELTATQKTQARFGLLMESTNKTAGDFANTSDSLANGMRILQAQVTDVQGEIGQALLPVLQDIMPVVRGLVTEFGDKLKTALANVNFKALITDLVNLVTFLVRNIEVISRLATGLLVLNTVYNAGKVAVGLYSAATFLLGNVFTVTAGKIGLATGALKLFKIALATTGIGALIVALGLIVQGATEIDSSYRKTTPVVTSFGTAVLNSGKDAEWAAGKYGTAKTALDQLNVAAGSFKGISAGASAADLAKVFGPLPKAGSVVDPLAAFTATSATGAATAKDPTGLKAWTANAKEEAKVTKKETRLISLGLGKDVAANLASGGLRVVNDAIKRVTKNGSTAITNLTKRYQGSAAGQAAAASAAADAAADAAAAVAAAAAAAAEAAAREAAILAEKQRVYEAFANSVISTFAGIRDSILRAFSLPELGGSTDSIIRNMDKLLTRVKAFSSNITKLSSMGLDPKLLQQVINAGPIAGAKLAANLVSGGVAGLNTINAGYAELGNVAGEIGMTGTQSLFNTAAQQAVYNVTVNGGLDSGATIGKAVVDAIRAYERTSGPVFQGA
jgi:hypothetical protein